jgi:hypothetical protein
MFSEAVIIVDHAEAPKYGVLGTSGYLSDISPALALKAM